MFDRQRLQDALVQYKRDFLIFQWKNERYKWEAIQCFQKNWDINAADFPGMLTRSLAKTRNLLVSRNVFPREMIQGFAKTEPETVRSMFIALFDENSDIVERIMAFKDKASALLEKIGRPDISHYQNENAISVYLWLRYPDKYYIYKYGEIRTVARELKSDYQFKKGLYGENIRHAFLLYDEICHTIKGDAELLSLFRSRLTDDCYPDPAYKTLALDVGFYISRYDSRRAPEAEQGEAWHPADYTPGLSVEQWVELLNDKEVFFESSLKIVKRLKDYGGAATCTQLAKKYGANKNFYNSGSQALARRIHKKTDCPIINQGSGSSWWPVLYVGESASADEEGVFIWKLRDELSAAMDKVDLSSVPLYESPEDGEEAHGYWWLNANPRIWRFSDIAAGEERSCTLLNENGNKRRVYQNFLDARPGDRVIGYESGPVRQIVATGRISAEQDGEKLRFEKVEGLSNPIDYQTLKECPELEKMEYFVNPQGSLFRLTKDEYDFILDIIREANPPAGAQKKKAYTKERFLSEVYLPESRYDMLAAVLKAKKNIILQGAPGVGKTYAARRLAYSMMGEEDDGRIEFVQFHQNYSYEDFVMGYKPENDGFVLKYGVFYRFCQKAANQPDKDFFFIIDEINRGNMSKIFGELLMLIEKDYRDRKAMLAYNGLSFSVPANLYIIGMMNTADRSLAMIDYALRRRFSFFDMEPGFDSEGFRKYQAGLNSDTFNELIEQIKQLNRDIASDRSLGKGFCIGHSYFCGQTKCEDAWMEAVVNFDILPMLNEYWFDDPAKYQRWENALRGVFQ